MINLYINLRRSEFFMPYFFFYWVRSTLKNVESCQAYKKHKYDWPSGKANRVKFANTYFVSNSKTKRQQWHWCLTYSIFLWVSTFSWSFLHSLVALEVPTLSQIIQIVQWTILYNQDQKRKLKVQYAINKFYIKKRTENCKIFFFSVFNIFSIVQFKNIGCTSQMTFT